MLEVIYLIFNEGYSATSGEDWMRPALCEDALRLGRILAGLMPGEPEVHGLVALMEIQASRSAARVGRRRRADPAPRSEPRAVGSGPHSARSGGTRSGRAMRTAAWSLLSSGLDCRVPRARARRPKTRTGSRIANLYAELVAVSPSPVVQLNRAVALSMAFGPQAGLDLVDTLVGEPALEQLPPAAERPR